MTFEKRCLIELNDILTIHYECDHCHSATVVPIEKLNPEQTASISIRTCPYCGTASGFQIGTNEMRYFGEFSVALRNMMGVMAGRNLKMRFGIKCE
jgi:hypothetical protein